MISTGGRSDVILQWFSRQYMIDNSKLFKDLVIGPGEQAMIIRKGAVEDIVTETQIRTAPGLWKRFKDRLFEKEDIQLLVADMGPKTLEVPFECYSKDRYPIKGTVNLISSVSDTNMISTLRLIREELVNDGKRSPEETADIKEVTLSDIINKMRKDMEIQLDMNILSQMNAAEIRDQRIDINKKLVSTLRSLTPYWINFGLNVEFSEIEISENAYETAERTRAETEIKQKMLDLEYAEASGNSGHAVRMHDLIVKEKSKKILIDNITKVDEETEIARHKLGAEQSIKVDTVQFKHILEDLESEHRRDSEKREVLHQSDIDVSKTETDIKIQTLELELERLKERSKIEDKLSSAQTDIEIRKLELELAHTMKVKETELELMKLRELSTIDNLASDAEVKREIEHYMNIGTNKDNIQREIKLEELRTQAAVAGSADKIEAAAAKAALDQYVTATDSQQKRAMEFSRVQVDAIAAANTAPTIKISDNSGAMCPNCKTQQRPNALYCSSCGAKL